jgi:hypothetical protein
MTKASHIHVAFVLCYAKELLILYISVLYDTYQHKYYLKQNMTSLFCREQ